MIRGMTVLERDKLRAKILKRELDKARVRAAEAGLTLRCKQAMREHDSVYLHARCQGEELGGRGCLCLCHDDRSGVVAGTAIEMGQDNP